ncbi:MAG: hypothetical protein GY771_17655 [bacterium]|nr:hypothetical protein [bacterium]
MRKVTLVILAFALAAGFAYADEFDTFWEETERMVDEFLVIMAEVQPHLNYPTGITDKEREDIVWDLEVIVNKLQQIRYDYDSMHVPVGMETAHGLIKSGLGMYADGVMRVGEGIDREYKQTYNGGIADVNNASPIIDQGYLEMEQAYNNR